MEISYNLSSQSLTFNQMTWKKDEDIMLRVTVNKCHVFFHTLKTDWLTILNLVCQVLGVVYKDIAVLKRIFTCFFNTVQGIVVI